VIQINNFPLFISASIMLNVIPGPDAIYIFSRSIAQGRKAGLLSSWGVCTGAFVHTVTAALGLSAILTTSVYAFTIMKYVGAIYLIYLGVKTFVDKANPLEIERTIKPSSDWAIFRQGVLVDILNPKAATFFLAFPPQFIEPTSKTKITSFIFLGVIVILISLIWEFILVMSSGAIAKYLRQNVSIDKHLNQLTGVVLTGVGIPG